MLHLVYISVKITLTPSSFLYVRKLSSITTADHYVYMGRGLEGEEDEGRLKNK